jgi:poly(glycerol-phosphate) alpha-glucosyltransferase
MGCLKGRSAVIIHEKCRFEINYEGHDYDFATFEDLTTFWLDQLNLSTGEANTIICDRAYELAYSVQKMETPIYSVMYLHNNHVNSGTDSYLL